MFRFLTLCFGTLVRLFRSRHSLLFENLALRQQLVVLKRRHPRPKLYLVDKLFWLVVRRCWSGWKQALLVVTPETVMRWHRAGFRWYSRVISKVRKPVGRRPTSKEVRDLMFQMVAENPSSGCLRQFHCAGSEAAHSESVLNIHVSLNHRLLLQLSCRGRPFRTRFASACSTFAVKCHCVFDDGWRFGERHHYCDHLLCRHARFMHDPGWRDGEQQVGSKCEQEMRT